VSKESLADGLFKKGRVHEVEKLQRETLQTMVRTLGRGHPDTLPASLARTLIREGHYAEAEKIAGEAFELQLRSLGPQHPDTLNTLQQLGTAMAHNYRYPEATKLFRDVIDKGSNSTGQGNRWSVWYSFPCVAVAANRPDDALQHLQEAINRGYKDADGLMAYDDLKSLRRNPKFQELVAELRPTKVQAQ
jgi:tetratricopeptide (TPR) repeat protein